MALDHKYGRVTLENGNIGEDEPVIVFRAQDALVPKLLAYYHLFCLRAGSPKHHLSAILDARDKVEAWQAGHVTKTPSSDALASADNEAPHA